MKKSDLHKQINSAIVTLETLQEQLYDLAATTAPERKKNYSPPSIFETRLVAAEMNNLYDTPSVLGRIASE